jgi:hypothetical protein
VSVAAADLVLVRSMRVVMILAALFVSSQALHSSDVHVEMNFSGGEARDWAGKRFRDIIPPEHIKRIVRLTERGFSSRQADYDALIDHLVHSDQRADDCATIGDMERSVGELLIVTSDERVFKIDILAFERIKAINIYGPDHAARIPVEGVDWKPRY